MYQVVGMIRAAEEIRDLDLERIVKKARQENDWSDETAKEAERKYRNFLLLIATTNNEKLVPTVEIDELWHGHILDTKAYARDCMLVFGHFVHHVPNFGQPEEDHDNMIVRTRELYKQYFGEEYSPEATYGCCGAPPAHCKPHNCFRMCCNEERCTTS